VAVLVASLFLFPSVRASAQAFLEMFRVRQFAAVQFDPARIEKLRALKDQNNALLVFDDQQVLRDPGPRVPYASLDAARAALNLPLRRLTFLPAGLAPESVFAEREGEARFTLHADKLRALLDQLGLSDVRVPDGFDGQAIQVRKPVVVMQQYKGGRSSAALMQSQNPEVGLPAGANLAQLGEVGLRVLGLDQAEAHRVATSIDWRSTLVVPVPLNASTFRPVTIHGNNGLLVTCTGGTRPDGKPRREGSVVIWSDGDHLFALETTLGGPDAVMMAESVQ
jgi:hypothetical protein